MMLVVKVLPASAGNKRDTGSIPGSEKSPEERWTHSSVLAWKIPWTGAWQATVHGITRVGHYWSNLALSKVQEPVQFSRSVVSDSLSAHALQQARLPSPYQLLESPQTHVHPVSDAIQPYHPLFSPSPPAFSLTHHQDLSQWVSSSHRGPKYWSFSFSSSLPNEYSGLISFRKSNSWTEVT